VGGGGCGEEGGWGGGGGGGEGEEEGGGGGGLSNDLVQNLAIVHAVANLPLSVHRPFRITSPDTRQHASQHHSEESKLLEVGTIGIGMNRN